MQSHNFLCLNSNWVLQREANFLTKSRWENLFVIVYNDSLLYGLVALRTYG